MFSHSVGSLFILLMISLAMQNLFSLMYSHLFILSFVSLAWEYTPDKKFLWADFWPRWRRRQTHCVSSYNQKKNNKFKNKKQPQLTENWTVRSSTTKELKKKHSSRLVEGAEIGSRAERMCGKAVTGGPSEVVDCGAGWTKLQLAGKAAAGGLGDGPHNPEF